MNSQIIERTQKKYMKHNPYFLQSNRNITEIDQQKTSKKPRPFNPKLSQDDSLALMRQKKLPYQQDQTIQQAKSWTKLQFSGIQIFQNGSNNQSNFQFDPTQNINYDDQQRQIQQIQQPLLGCSVTQNDWNDWNDLNFENFENIDSWEKQIIQKNREIFDHVQILQNEKDDTLDTPKISKMQTIIQASNQQGSSHCLKSKKMKLNSKSQSFKNIFSRQSDAFSPQSCKYVFQHSSNPNLQSSQFQNQYVEQLWTNQQQNYQIVNQKGRKFLCSTEISQQKKQISQQKIVKNSLNEQILNRNNQSYQPNNNIRKLKNNFIQNLTYEHYLKRQASQCQLQLYQLTLENQFMKYYVQQCYEPQKLKLQEKLRQKIQQITKLKNGKYMSNLIMNECLQQLLKMSQLQEFLDNQIQRMRFQKNSQDQILNKKYGNKDNVITQNQNTTLQNQSSYSKQQPRHTICPSNSKGFIQKNKNLSLHEENKQIKINPQIQHLQSFQDKQQAKQKNYNTQINQQFSEVQNNQKSQILRQLELRYQLDLEQFSRLSEQKRLIQQRISTAQDNMNHLKNIFNQEFKNNSSINQTYQSLLKNENQNKLISQNQTLNLKIKTLNQSYSQKINQLKTSKIQTQYNLHQLTQHYFDVLYIQLQIAINQQKKQFLPNDKKILQQLKLTDSCQDKAKQQFKLFWFYQYFINLEIENLNNDNANLINHKSIIDLNIAQNEKYSQNIKSCSMKAIIKSIQSFQDISGQKQKFINLYRSLQLGLKVFLCVKIQQYLQYESNSLCQEKEKKNIDKKLQIQLQRIPIQPDSDRKKQFIFNKKLTSLYNLIDSNSYHSKQTKQNFFKFTDQFSKYFQILSAYLLEEIIQNNSCSQININKVKKYQPFQINMDKVQFISNSIQSVLSGKYNISLKDKKPQKTLKIRQTVQMVTSQQFSVKLKNLLKKLLFQS